jgi:hypothetical protein
MGRARSETAVDLSPAEAFDLWTDVSRWPTFVDGFGHVERVDDDWPAPGAKVVWRSGPSGRGLVTERVRGAERGEVFVTDVIEERLTGSQTVAFFAGPPGESYALMSIELDYTVQAGGPLRPIMDFLFINRAQRDALARTLRRFRTEAAEQAAL